MGVQGPLARSATDLEMLFDVVAGPDRRRSHRMAARPAGGPTPAARRLPRGGHAPAVARATVGRDAGARSTSSPRPLATPAHTVGEAMPDVDHDAYLRDYLTLLSTIMIQGQSRGQREAGQRDGCSTRATRRSPRGVRPDARCTRVHGCARPPRDGAGRVASFFVDWDVLVCPTALDVAFPHQSGDANLRTMSVDDRPVPYWQNLVYPMWAIFAGQPATAFPAGRGTAGSAARAAGDRAVPRGSHHDAFRPAARARVARLRRPPAFA